MTIDATTPGQTKSKKRNIAWQALRALLEAEQSVSLKFKSAESAGWLMARFRGIPCYLPKSEIAGTADQEVYELSIKVVKTSRKLRSALVTTRLSATIEQLQQEAAQRQAVAAKRKRGLDKQAASEKGALAEFGRLKEGATVSGTVLHSIKLKPKRGKASLLYFVKIGEHLVGAIREQDLPCVDGGKTRRTLTKGEKLDVRVHRKYAKVDQKTGKSKPKVDLTSAVSAPKGE